MALAVAMRAGVWALENRSMDQHLMSNDALHISCETCHDTGEIDETLGGISTSDPHAPCPDCRARVPIQRYVMPKPKPLCSCKHYGRLRLVNLNCSVHSAGGTDAGR